MTKRQTSKPKSITASLRKAVVESGENYRQLERETSVKRQSLMKFVRGEQSLRLDMADKLAQHFRLALARQEGD